MTGSHPDATLAGRVTAALAWWTAQEPAGGPTSSLTGAGAVDALERRVAALVGVRHALALPSATAALRAGLSACGARPGRATLVCREDWPAAAAAAASLGSPVVRLPAAELPTARTAYQVAAVTPEACSDLPGLAARTGALLVEDRCRESVLAPRPLEGVVGVYSLGPGKALDCGEGGLLVTDDAGLWRAAVAASQHPVRQLLAGAEPDADVLMARVHPVAAVVGLWELRGAP